MRRARRMPALVAALLLLLAPAGAHAVDGTIQDLSFNPDPATAGQNVIITVLGNGKCKKISIDFGDESPPVELNNPNFDDANTNDNSVTHVYANAGTYSVKAEPLQDCNPPMGEKSSILVEPNAFQLGALPATKDMLCAILGNCGKIKIPASGADMIAPDPVIESILPFSVIEPGGTVLIFGKRFGMTKPKLTLRLKSANQTSTLTVNDWGAKFVAGTIPSSLSGVIDQSAEFFVKRGVGGDPSNPYPVNFTAKRELKLLPRADVQASYDGCGKAADCDRCVASTDSCCEVFEKSCFVSISSAGTLSGYHWQDCGLIGDDKGTDTYTTVKFKNSWELDHADIYNTVDPGEGWASLKGLYNTSDPPKIKVKWSISPCDGISYKLYVFIKGPVATSYK